MLGPVKTFYENNEWLKRQAYDYTALPLHFTFPTYFVFLEVCL